jgi:hypothetical protein
VMSRRLLRKRHPGVAMQDLFYKCRSRIVHAVKP